jgi:hypothetical protein
MALMWLMGALLVVGLIVTLAWGGSPYEAWRPTEQGGEGGSTPAAHETPTVVAASRRYLRGVAVALVGGFWAGALVTGPAMRLIMRLLAVTGGDDAQGRITEADEVVGDIALDGTIGLYLFGGVLPGLLSGAIYVVVRRWLPSGRLGGVAFGLLHLVVAATRVDPLRPDNRDFDIVGPGWLSVLTFGLAAVAHGMAVAAVANRFSRVFPPAGRQRAVRLRAGLPLVPPLLLLIPGVTMLVPIGVGLVVAVVLLKVDASRRITASRPFQLGGSVALALLAITLAPGAVADLRDIVARR